MKLVECYDYEESVQTIKSEMIAYYSERDLTWDDDRKLELYRECDLWTILDREEVGFAMTQVNGGHFYLAELHIKENSRNNGYGAKSLKLASELAESLGYSELRLRVFKNSPAYKLYLRSGFSVEKELPHTYQLVAKTQCIQMKLAL